MEMAQGDPILPLGRGHSVIASYSLALVLGHLAADVGSGGCWRSLEGESVYKLWSGAAKEGPWSSEWEQLD